jgi:hypothetical protein
MAIKQATVRAFELGDGLSGLKTLIGVLMILAAHSLGATQELIKLLPDVVVLAQIQEILIQLIAYLGKALNLLGGGFLGVGILGKVVKFFAGLIGR